MKKQLSILATLIISLYSFITHAEEIIVYQSVEVEHEELYKTALKTCDQIYQEDSAKAATNADVLNTTISLIKCYEKIGISIIDKFYSNDALNQKVKLKNYVNIADELTSGIFENQDYCAPECGQLSKLEAKDAAADMIKYVIEEYIVAVSRN